MTDFTHRTKRCGVLVAGAGAAGMSAAIAAARAGARVVLADRSDQPGGTVAHALIHTLGGIFDFNGNFLNDGIVRELVDRLQSTCVKTQPREISGTRVLSVDPEVYQRVTTDWLAEETSIQVAVGHSVADVSTRDDSISSVTFQTANGAVEISAAEVIDTTGSGEVARRAAPGSLMDRQDRAAAGWVVTFGGAKPGALKFPAGMRVTRCIRKAADRGELPPLAKHAWFDQGIADDEVYLKLFIPLGEEWRKKEQRGDYKFLALELSDAIIRHVQQQIPALANVDVRRFGELGVRDGGRIRGQYVLTADDVRSGRKFDDAVCRCDWPIEFWHPETAVSVEKLPDGCAYEIPLRSLRHEHIANLLMAGKCLSADPFAQASARVIGTCWSTGEAVGQFAAAQIAANTIGEKTAPAISHS